MVVLGKILDSFQKSGEKTLVFSYSIRTLDLIESFIKCKGWQYSRIDGTTTNRQSVVNAFNKSVSNLIFLVSTKAGGVGLNLASASKVVIFDCNWNPSWDMQAQDRAYRYYFYFYCYCYLFNSNIAHLNSLKTINLKQYTDSLII